MNNNLLRINDLVNNPTPRVPICLCLDTSGTMNAVEEGTYREEWPVLLHDQVLADINKASSVLNSAGLVILQIT